MTALSLKARQAITPLRLQMAMGFAARGTSAVASFVLTWLIARQFGATGVGLYSIALTTATICATLSLGGLEYVTVRQAARLLKLDRPGEARRALSGAVRQVAFTSTILALALFALRVPIAERLLEQPQAAPFLGVMALAIPLLAFTRLASAALRGGGHVMISQVIDGPIGTGFAAVALAVLMWLGLANDRLITVVLYCLFASLAVIIGWAVLVRVVRGWGPAAGPRPMLLRTGIPILVITLSQLFVDWFALLVLTAEAGPAQAGLFRVAFQIVSVLNLLNVASESILAPVIAQEHAAGRMDRIAQVVSRTALLLVVAGAPLLLVCFFAPGWILGLFGAEFRVAATPLAILAGGQLVNLAMGPIGGVLIMTHHERWSLAYGVIAATGATALCLWLIPPLGVTGAAVAVTAATIFRRLSAAAIVRFVVGIELWRWRARPLAGTEQ